MKNYIDKPDILKGYINNILLIIHLTTVIVMISMLQVRASTVAKEFNDVKKRAPFIDIFTELKKPTDYNIWNENIIDVTTTIDAHITKAAIHDGLNNCFSNFAYSYSLDDKIVMKEVVESSFIDRNVSILNVIDVRGRVVDENGTSLVGATIKVKGSDQSTKTNGKGEFRLSKVDEKAILVVSFLGHETLEIAASENVGIINLRIRVSQLEEIKVSTGYQTLNQGSTTGSFIHLDNKLLNRSISTNVLERIKNLVPGLYFEERDPQTATIAQFSHSRNSGITVRGQSTIRATKEPLIILDNFPYEGEITNINPNDVENITVLKDAASAAIWGAKSGNGVIVITTKKGSYNKKMQLDISSNLTIINKPDLMYSQNYLAANSFIEVEQFLFDKGYFNDQLNDNTSFPVVSPAVELMAQYKSATLDIQRSLIQNELITLKNIDVRDDYSKYVYQQAINQQYSLGIRGGTNNMNYTVSVGRDNNNNNLIRNGYSRTSINALNNYVPFKNFELTTGLNYSRSITSINNEFPFGMLVGLESPYSKLYPYARLADAEGNHLPILQNLRSSYIQSTANIGFLDWRLKPLDEIDFADHETNVTDLLIKVGLKYNFLPELNIQVNFQNERQIINDRNYRSIDTYYARNLINRFSVYNPETNAITYAFPKDGILDLGDTNWNSQNFRGLINYEKLTSKHNISLIAGAEMSEIKIDGYNRTSYGYNDQFGLSTNNLDYSGFHNTNPSGSDLIPPVSGIVNGQLNRQISYFAKGQYEFNGKYTFESSFRRDGANLFGAKTNDKFQPFISAGIGWNISKESFFNPDWLPTLRLRASYGYQGNTYQFGSAYLTGFYTINNISGASSLLVTSAANPRLQWERVKNINLGIDFTSKNAIISGTIEVYKKNGIDLIQPTALPSQTGFTTFLANTASTQTNGIDVNIRTQNLIRKFKWSTSLVLSSINDKVVKYNVPLTSTSITNYSYALNKPLYSIFSYKWAGLNPINGNPRGMLNGQISEDYSSIIDNFNPDSLVNNGSAIPTLYGALRNDFSFKGFSLSVNISYRLGYVFRRSSTVLNYENILTTGQHPDYNLRWQTPGDESKTNVPSLIYPKNANRDMFYQFSNTLVESGDHIRLQDIRVSYDLSSPILKRLKISNFSIFSYANNLGIIWRKNKLGIDPSAVFNAGTSYPNPFMLSFGIKTNF